MNLILDVQYSSDSLLASVAGILFDNHKDCKIDYLFKKIISGPFEPYEPGFFYKRELPPLLNLIQDIKNCNIDFDIVVIDGFVKFSDDKKALGWFLHEKINKPIIGIAKTNFLDSNSLKIFRGESKNPLYVTNISISDEDTFHFVKEMHGEFRLPTLVKEVDKICRDNLKN